MKKLKLNLIVLLAILFLGTSCDNEGLYDYDTNGFNDEWTDDGDWDDDGDGHGHGGDESLVRLTSYKISGNKITKIQDFNISQEFEYYQQDINTHQKMWEYYIKLIPAENRNYITEFMIFHGQGDIAGYVEPINENNLSKWRMGLSIDMSGDLNSINLDEDFAYVTIHEYGHVLTLNSSQVNVGGNENSCPNFHTGEGCSNSNSYINALFELGWADIYEESFDYQDDPYAFYLKYKSRFVTDYAATNPGEDIAEVFSVFVTQNQQPTGNTIADQKVRLMYDYPELVQLRNQIRNQNPVLRTMQAGSWVKRGKHQTCKQH